MYIPRFFVAWLGFGIFMSFIAEALIPINIKLKYDNLILLLLTFLSAACAGLWVYYTKDKI